MMLGMLHGADTLRVWCQKVHGFCSKALLRAPAGEPLLKVGQDEKQDASRPLCYLRKLGKLCAWICKIGTLRCWGLSMRAQARMKHQPFRPHASAVAHHRVLWAVSRQCRLVRDSAASPEQAAAGH